MQVEHDPAFSVTEQAALWWEVLHSDDVSAAEHREFAQWVLRSPERVAAYLRAARVQQALHSSSIRWPDTPAETLIREAQSAPPEPLRMPLANVVALPPARRRTSVVRVRSVVALAAAVLLAVGVVWLMPANVQQFYTNFGEQRSVLLEDGSRITLNSASRIEVRLRKSGRLVELIEGEALFEVAHDPARPFDVQAGNATVRVVGTRFNVDRRSDHTTVTVVDGRVAVGSVQAPLGAGDQVVVTAQGAGSVRHDVNVVAAIAWTQQQLVFEQRTLGEIAAEFNRYNRKRIAIEDAGLREQKITAVFRAHDVDSFVSFLSGIPGARVRDDGAGGYVVIRDVEQPSTP